MDFGYAVIKSDGYSVYPIENTKTVSIRHPSTHSIRLRNLFHEPVVDLSVEDNDSYTIRSFEYCDLDLNVSTETVAFSQIDTSGNDSNSFYML